MPRKEVENVVCPGCGNSHPVTQLMMLGWVCPDCLRYDSVQRDKFEAKTWNRVGEEESGE